MKRTFLCFLVFCFAFSVAGAADLKLVPLDAKLEIINGQVKLTRVGSTITDVITHSCELYSGDLLETLRESRATLVYGDGTTMRLKERTLIEVQPMSIKVFKGKTWYKFTKRGTEFKIETPTLVAGIRGTEFEVAVSSRKKASVSVLAGAVSVNSFAKGKSMLLRPGMATHCEPGCTLVPAYKFNVALKKNEWNSADWQKKSETGTEDLNSLYINHTNLNREYGSDDPRTQDALKKLKDYMKKLEDAKK